MWQFLCAHSDAITEAELCGNINVAIQYWESWLLGASGGYFQFDGGRNDGRDFQITGVAMAAVAQG
jgi:hypothetical protein